jgi:uncharacterized protein YdeI (YjbR/CyaY-like superfamily)
MSMTNKENKIETFCPASQKAWRQWLQKNHDKKQSVWLIYFKMKTGKRTLSWSEAVDEALCFGWIDSRAKPVDEEKYAQLFSRRKASSTWSKVNKEKVQQLIDDGRMTSAGLQSIEIAKQNGSWTMLDEVEALVIPDDLEKAFKSKRGSRDFFMSLSKSIRKSILQWIVLAKRAETRLKRVNEIAVLAGKKSKPKQF